MWALPNNIGCTLASLRSEGMGALCQQSLWFAKESCPQRSAGEPNR